MRLALAALALPTAPGLAALLALAPLPATAQEACPEGQRPFAHAQGEACIPEAPERIAALRHDQIATPLLDIGAPVVASQMERMEDGAAYVRGASDIFGQDVVDAAGLIDIGAGNPLDLEAIAAASPDLIIGRVWEAEAYDQLSAIAPTVIVPDNLPYLDHLAFLAEAAGSSGSYEARLDRYRARVEEARAVIGDPSAITLSRFDLWEDGLWFYPNWGAVDQVIDDLGFDRPAIQAEAEEGINGLSVERLPEFDGDVLIASRAPRFGQTIPMLTEQWDGVAPFWRDLSAVEAGELYWYERDVWVGYAFASLDAVLDGLTLITAGREFD